MGYKNVGGDIDEVLGTRVKFAGLPIRWVKGEGSIVRLVEIIEQYGGSRATCLLCGVIT